MKLDVKAVRLAMIDKELNITSLSKISGISTATLNLWLNHGTQPRIDKIGKLSAALGLPITALLKED